jgi:hypothetical protein
MLGGSLAAAGTPERWRGWPRPARAAHAQATAGFGGDRWPTAPEAVAYDMADELIGGLAGAPESGTSA